MSTSRPLKKAGLKEKGKMPEGKTDQIIRKSEFLPFEFCLLPSGCRLFQEPARGFSLIEVMIATLILTFGVLSLVGVMALGIQRAGSSSASLIAREKAREAVESVHTARDTGELSWATIRNVADGGVFLDGQRPLTTSGLDGLVNTADDVGIEALRTPGADGILGNTDDLVTPLTDYTREIVISDLPNNDGLGINPNLREIVVNVRYRVNNYWRTYTLRTFVSAFS